MHRCNRLFRKVLASALLIASIGAAHAQIDPLVQPRGIAIPGLPEVLVIVNGAQANTYPPLGATPTTPPFNASQPAGVVRTTEATEYYVRLYQPPATQAERAWIMRASTVRGLTITQLVDRFALPFTPTYITNVLVPAGTCLLSGPAGPIAGWGTGGAQQTWIVGRDHSSDCTDAKGHFLDPGSYINRRPLGANALWYAPVVGSGNAGNVGAYLDHLPAPAEYSDLYNAYNTLDVLNDGTATRLAPALTELTGANHASAMWTALANADRAARTLSDHARGALNGGQAALPLASAMMSYAAVPEAAAAARADRGVMSSGRWWVAGGGVFGRVGGSNERSGYRFGGGQAIVGYDWSVPDWLAGAAVAVESTNLTTDGANNNNTVTTVRAGTYGATEFRSVTLAASALLSWDHYVTSRDLPSFASSAAATYDGWSAAFSLDASRAYILGTLRIEPLAGLSFVGLSRPGFTETGAGALSLVVDRQNTTKLASRLGATLSAPLPLGDKLLRPWLRAFWAHDFLDSEGSLNAAFAGATAPGTFNVLSASAGRDVALVGAGARFELTPTSSLLVAYDGEWGRDASLHSIKAGATVTW